MTDSNISALIEAIIYLAEEPVRLDQIVKALKGVGDGIGDGVGKDRIAAELEALKKRYAEPDRGIEIREVADGYRFSTKPEHHEVLTHFARSLVPPTRLSLAALETLAVIAYRQPVTVPEIQEIRGVQASGVIKTLLDRKLVTAAGRKDVIGRPILYKTTRNFLLHFGLKNLDELPSMEEFEELIKSEHAEGAVQAELPMTDPGAPETATAEAGQTGTDETGADQTRANQTGENQINDDAEVTVTTGADSPLADSPEGDTPADAPTTAGGDEDPIAAAKLAEVQGTEAPASENGPDIEADAFPDDRASVDNAADSTSSTREEDDPADNFSDSESDPGGAKVPPGSRT